MGVTTTRPGYCNKHGQVVVGLAITDSNHWNQKVYELACQRCNWRYGANGCDIHIRRCPTCQQGSPGLSLD